LFVALRAANILASVPSDGKAQLAAVAVELFVPFLKKEGLF
jgi:hypothetical protein